MCIQILMLYSREVFYILTTRFIYVCLHKLSRFCFQNFKLHINCSSKIYNTLCSNAQSVPTKYLNKCDLIISTSVPWKCKCGNSKSCRKSEQLPAMMEAPSFPLLVKYYSIYFVVGSRYFIFTYQNKYILQVFFRERNQHSNWSYTPRFFWRVQHLMGTFYSF